MLFLEKTMDVRKHRDIKIVTTEGIANCLVLEPNYHTTNIFTEQLLVTEV